MELQNVYKYEQKLFDIINRYSLRIQQVIIYIDLVILAFIKIYERIIFTLPEVLNAIQKIMRYTTFPIHWLWIKRELKKQQSDKITDLRLFEKGGHYIYGKPRAGKSSSVYHAMMDYAYFTGKTSYTTQMMESSRLNVYGQEYYLHQLFDPSEFFQEGKQVAQFNTRRHNVVVYEEMLVGNSSGGMHQRNNKKKSYNDEMLPLVASMAGQAHQGEGLDLFYFISQLPTNDISLMQMLRGYHIPKIKKVLDYKNWLETGKFKFKIAGWYIESYHITPTGRSDYKLTNMVKWFYPCKHQNDMEFFDTYNLKDFFENLPKHKGAGMK